MQNPINQKLDNFFSQFRERRFKKGQVIIRAEDEPGGVYYLTSGFVRFYSIFEDGKELTLNIFKPGSYFPMLWALADIPNVYFFEPITNVSVRQAPKSKVLEFIKINPDIFYELTKRLMVGFAGLMVRFEQLLTQNAQKKVASVFYLSARRFGDKNGNGQTIISFPLTHQEIANLANLTRETTSLEIKKLEVAGTISKKNRLWTVNDLGKLKEESYLYTDGKTFSHTFQ